MLWMTVLLLWGWFTAWYVLSMIMKNAGIVDIGWGLGFVVLAAAALLREPEASNVLFVIPVIVWGVRLAWHIGQRNFGKPEDFRYAAFRRDWGSAYYPRAYVQLFLFQGLLMGIIAMSYLAAIASSQPIHWGLAALGYLVWGAGFLAEAMADAQLKAFIASPEKGTFIESGLWKFTRHPNYVGESVLWWGIWLLALSGGAPLYTVVSPILITCLLRYVSGVPMLEKRLQSKPGFAEYAARVPIFSPSLFKKNKIARTK